MVIAIIILSILLFISLSANFVIWFAIDKLIDNFIENNPTEAMKYYLKQNAEETYPCTPSCLLLRKYCYGPGEIS